MLTRKTPELLHTELTIKGQGEVISMIVDFHNRTQAQIQTVMDESASSPIAETDFQYANRQVLLYLVKSMDAEYPLTDAGVAEMERDRPGMIEALFIGYHQARKVEITKN